MISLDVTALFTNVPLDLVLDFLRRKHEEGIFSPPIPISEFLDLIKLCTDSTIFTFNGDAYQQKFGVAMGSPLSPVLANICMEMFESEYLPLTTKRLRPSFGLHYVNDVFVI